MKISIVYDCKWHLIDNETAKKWFEIQDKLIIKNYKNGKQ